MRTFLIENVFIYAQPEDYDHIQRVLITLSPNLGRLQKGQWYFETQIEGDHHKNDLIIVDNSKTSLGVGFVLEAISQGAVFMQWIDHGSLSVYHKGKYMDSGDVERGEITRFKKCRFKALIQPVELPVSS